MQSCDVPALAEPSASGGLTDMLHDHAERDPTRALVAVREGGDWRDVTAAELRADVTAIAKGLIANGIQAGDRVGLMCRTRYEWTLFDYALWTVGACPVAVYPTSAPDQVSWILGDSGAVACVVENADHAATVGSVRDELPALREIWTVDDSAVAALRHAGAGLADSEVARRRHQVEPDQPATIIYTSGTTGRPKGCVLTHRNFLAEVDNAVELLYPMFRAHSRHPAATVIFVPLAHVLGRMLQVGCVRAGVKLGHEPSMSHDDLRRAFQSFRPTFVVGVPHVFEKIYDTARHTAARMGRTASFDRAAAVAIRWAEALERKHTWGGRGPDVGLWLAHACYDLLVFRRIRAQLGGRLRYALCGGSALDRRLALFFAGTRLLIYEGYGLTETTAAATVNPPLAPKFGTAGRPLPGTSLRIADDGEILVHGGQVFADYWNNRAASDAAFDDGWLRTGDLGQLDEHGYLTVTGRKKDLLVTSGGKNVVPGPLEDRIRAHPLVSQCLVVGDNRPFVAALVTVDAEAAKEWAKLHLPEAPLEPKELAEHPSVVAEIQGAVDAANAAVSRAESVRAFRVLPDEFTEENSLLTPSLKVKRPAAVERYAETIDEIYRARHTG